MSASHEAFASVRVIGPCMGEGQAAGAAVALAASGATPLPRIDTGALRAQLGGLGVPI